MSINPETVTSRELFGSFNAKHWVATIGTTLAAFSAIAYGAYWVGQRQSDSQALTRQAEMQGTIGQLQAKLETSQTQVTLLSNNLTQWHEAYQKATQEIAKQRAEIVSLSTALGKANNCTFIHEQIKAINDRLQWLPSLLIWGGGKAAEDRNAEERASLERQRATYADQLGTCNK